MVNRRLRQCNLEQMIKIIFVGLFFLSTAFAQQSHEITVRGTCFEMDGKPFPYTGVSFFNAIYNPNFNNPAQREQWLLKFKRYGINVLRIWAQWDNKRGFVDTCPDCTLYMPDGSLRQARLESLKKIVADADRHGMVVELTLFSQESWHDDIRLGAAASDRATAAITREMIPYRNLTLQVWNEFSERVLEHVATIRAIDRKRLVTNSPGFGGVLGDQKQNGLLDYLTPHTTRQNAGKPWLHAPEEIRYLVARFHKPVVSDEPARNGTPQFGGPNSQTYPFDHILELYRTWEAGGYITYHHDMFQTGHNTPAVPPSGVPDPEFSPYHRSVFEFLALRERYMPTALIQR